MSEEEIKEVPEKKAWRVEKCCYENVEDVLNELAAGGYNIFKIEVLSDEIRTAALFAVIVAFDPMHMVKMMQQGQLESIRQLMASGKMDPIPGFTPPGARR